SQENMESFYSKVDGEEIFTAINPETDLNDIKTSGVLIMGIHPGFQGQDFIPETIEKISRLRSKYISNGVRNLIIGVDGGINENNAKLIVDAGADYLVIGSHILKGNINENLEKIQQAVKV